MNIPGLTTAHIAAEPIAARRMVAHGAEPGSVVTATTTTALILGVTTAISCDAGDHVDVIRGQLALVTYGATVKAGYPLPLPHVPLILKGWARAIVRYRLHAHRISDEKSDPIVRDYRDALNLLGLVAVGKFSLGLGDPLPPAGGKPAVTGPGRTFSMDSLQDYGK